MSRSSLRDARTCFSLVTQRCGFDPLMSLLLRALPPALEPVRALAAAAGVDVTQQNKLFTCFRQEAKRTRKLRLKLESAMAPQPRSSRGFMRTMWSSRPRLLLLRRAQQLPQQLHSVVVQVAFAGFSS